MRYINLRFTYLLTFFLCRLNQNSPRDYRPVSITREIFTTEVHMQYTMQGVAQLQHIVSPLRSNVTVWRNFILMYSRVLVYST